MRPLVTTAAKKSSHLFCLLVFLSLTGSAPITHVAAQNQSAQQIASEIKKASRELVANNSLVVRKPFFEFNKSEKRLDYYLGGVRPALIGFDANNSYFLPFQKQIQIEALRKLFSEAASAEKFWQPILAQLEQIVLGMVTDIESTTDSAELQNKLNARELQFDAKLGLLQQELGKFAKGKGYKASRVGSREPASDSYEVPIVKNPANGRVQVLPYLVYIQCNAMKKCGASWPWRELVSEKENLIGPYYYRAEWPGGRRNEGMIEVRNATTITFIPRN